MPLNDLTFDDFQSAVSTRSASAFPEDSRLTPLEVAAYLAGEVGELIGAFQEDPKSVGSELADVVTYCALLADRLGLDLGDLVAKKFDEVSLRRNWHTIKLDNS